MDLAQRAQRAQSSQWISHRGRRGRRAANGSRAENAEGAEQDNGSRAENAEGAEQTMVSRAESAEGAEQTMDLAQSAQRRQISRRERDKRGEDKQGSGCHRPSGSSRFARAGGPRDLRNKQPGVSMRCLFPRSRDPPDAGRRCRNGPRSHPLRSPASLSESVVSRVSARELRALRSLREIVFPVSLREIVPSAQRC